MDKRKVLNALVWAWVAGAAAAYAAQFGNLIRPMLNAVGIR